MEYVLTALIVAFVVVTVFIISKLYGSLTDFEILKEMTRDNEKKIESLKKELSEVVEFIDEDNKNFSETLDNIMYKLDNLTKEKEVVVKSKANLFDGTSVKKIANSIVSSIESNNRKKENKKDSSFNNDSYAYESSVVSSSSFYDNSSYDDNSSNDSGNDSNNYSSGGSFD